MTIKQTLKEALAVVTKDHTSTQLAVDQNGVKVGPLEPSAVAWSSTGALIKVAPSGLRAPALQHTETAGEAYDLLGVVAVQQGYLNVASVDRAGQAAAVRMFWRALQLVPDPERHTGAGRGTGSAPRGAVA